MPPKIAPWQFKPGQSGNPGGRVKNDVAREIAKAIFENNAEGLYQAYAKAALRGNAYCFKELSDRAFGKLKEEHQLTGADSGPIEFRGVSDQDLQAQMDEICGRLGLVEQIDAITGEVKLRNLDDVARDAPPADASKPDTPRLESFPGDSNLHKA